MSFMSSPPPFVLALVVLVSCLAPSIHTAYSNGYPGWTSLNGGPSQQAYVPFNPPNINNATASQRSSGMVSPVPVPGPEYIYVAQLSPDASNCTLIAYSYSNLDVMWNYTFVGELQNDMVVDGNGTVFMAAGRPIGDTGYSMQYLAIDQTGNLKWNTTIPTNDGTLSSSLVLNPSDPSSLYVPFNNSFVRLCTDTGKVVHLWDQQGMYETTMGQLSLDPTGVVGTAILQTGPSELIFSGFELLTGLSIWNFTLHTNKESVQYWSSASDTSGLAFAFSLVNNATQICAIHATTGVIAWNTTIPGLYLQSSLSVVQICAGASCGDTRDMVISVGSPSDNINGLTRIVGISSLNGSVVWTYPIPNVTSIITAPTIDPTGRVVFPVVQGFPRVQVFYYALDPGTGKVLARRQLEGADPCLSYSFAGVAGMDAWSFCENDAPSIQTARVVD